MERLIQTHAGHGKLIVEENQPAAEVTYSVGEFQEYEFPCALEAANRKSHTLNGVFLSKDSARGLARH